MREEELDRLLRELCTLQIRTERVLTNIEALRRPPRQVTSFPPLSESTRAPTFLVGDHVYIRNQVRHVPNGRRTNPADRAAIVERVTGNRVEIQTANGYRTWRVVHNLRPITEEQYNEYVHNE